MNGEVFQPVQCPFCGQRFDVSIDTSIPDQQFTSDCEVCCRPFEVVVRCKSGQVIALEIQ